MKRKNSAFDYCFFSAERKKDPFYLPLRANEGDHAGLLYLQQATEIFERWRSSRKAGLTSETFTACIQTMSAIPKLAAYLVKNHSFQYLLSGKLMSDPIEARFAWYRQVNGGNFFMSVRQLLLAEKKIISLSLLQKHTLLSATKLEADRLQEISASSENDSTLTSADEYMWLVEYLLAVIALDEMPLSDVAVIYYVSGHIGRRVSRRRKCSDCTNLLITRNDAPELCENVPEEQKEIVNRGGLSEPTELCFAITALAVQCYAAISGNVIMMRRLLTCGNQRQVFMNAVCKMSCSMKILSNLVHVKCRYCHENFCLILHSVFNCCAKNQLNA